MSDIGSWETSTMSRPSGEKALVICKQTTNVRGPQRVFSQTCTQPHLQVSVRFHLGTIEQSCKPQLRVLAQSASVRKILGVEVETWAHAGALASELWRPQTGSGEYWRVASCRWSNIADVLSALSWGGRGYLRPTLYCTHRPRLNWALLRECLAIWTVRYTRDSDGRAAVTLRPVEPVQVYSPRYSGDHRPCLGAAPGWSLVDGQTIVSVGRPVRLILEVGETGRSIPNCSHCPRLNWAPLGGC